MIWLEPRKGISRGRVRERRVRGRKRGKGQGSKKGARGARVGKKRLWVERVRMLRYRLKVLRDRGDITNEKFKLIYRQIKGGQIRTAKRLEDELQSQARR